MKLVILRDKDPGTNDFDCRDGEIDIITKLYNDDNAENDENADYYDNADTTITLIPTTGYPTANLRIALQNGEREKAASLLSGEISRVDPATADRITQAITQAAARFLLNLSTDLRRQGLFILPFRVYTMRQLPDGSLSYPSPQAIALPADFAPNPEITAFSVTDDSLTLSLRIPVRPHRLKAEAVTQDGNESLKTFISYPLYIPDPKDIYGSIGSVTSATGGNATGIRFSFLTTSAIKASVAAPEKYYRLTGNERTGYTMATKAAPTPDYTMYSKLTGGIRGWPKEALIATGADADPYTDPLDWIADWEKRGERYLPASLPYIFTDPAGEDAGLSGYTWPAGIDIDDIRPAAAALGMRRLLLTRPMALADTAADRNKGIPQGIRSLRIAGLPHAPCHAIIYGSHDGVHYEPMRHFNPFSETLLMLPPRLRFRLLILSRE